LANIKSAKKRIKVTEKKHMRNKSVRSSTKTAVKKLLAAVEAGDKTQATEAHKLAVKAIDQATSKGIYHKNTASRKKSQLARLVAQ
jgi:small subunit ribosomal protein S20